MKVEGFASDPVPLTLLLHISLHTSATHFRSCETLLLPETFSAPVVNAVFIKNSRETCERDLTDSV